MKSLHIFVLCMCISLGLTACYYDNKESMYGTTACDTNNVTYTTKIAPVLSQKCVGCHNTNNATAGVDLSSFNQAVKYSQTKQLQGTINQLPGYETKLMPPSGKMDNCNLKVIDIWIRKGMPQ